MLFKNLQREVSVSICNPILKSLHTQLDKKDLIRVTTRLIQREDTDAFSHLIALNSNHTVVYLIILEHHKHSIHAGVHTLISELRET